jgi:hypothetical protein
MVKNKNEKNNNKLKFIDLFAGIGYLVVLSIHCQTVMDSLDN